MRPTVLALVSVCLGSIGQVLLKVGVGRIGGVRFDQGSLFKTLLRIAMEPAIIGGVVLFATSMVMWLGVISTMELSSAHPVLGLSYVLIALLSRVFLGEAITPNRLAGIALILAGVTLVTK